MRIQYKKEETYTAKIISDARTIGNMLIRMDTTEVGSVHMLDLGFFPSDSSSSFFLIRV